MEDQITGNRITYLYNYHHGYYDGGEREFRGFGWVDHFDAEEFTGNSDAVASKRVLGIPSHFSRF